MDTPSPVETPLGAAPSTPPTPASSSSNGNDSRGPKDQVRNYVDQFEAWLDEHMVTKAPFQIPMGGKEFLATIAPYLVIVGAVLFLISLPVLLGLGAIGGAMGMTSGHPEWGFVMLVMLITNVIVIVLELYALSGLFKRTKASWRLVYYATLVSFVGNILSFNILGAIIGGIIGWYLLFQVKELYKN